MHDARHTSGTLTAEQGVSIQVIQQVLGHTQISTTLAYTHATAGPTHQAARRIGDLLWT